MHAITDKHQLAGCRFLCRIVGCRKHEVLAGFQRHLFAVDRELRTHSGGYRTAERHLLEITFTISRRNAQQLELGGHIIGGNLVAITAGIPSAQGVIGKEFDMRTNFCRIDAIGIFRCTRLDFDACLPG